MNDETTVRQRQNCSPLSPEELARFRELLLTEQSAVLASCQGLSHVALRQSGDAGGDDASVTEDAADMSASLCEQDLSLGFLGRAQAELQEIGRALDRIDRRSYGLCDGCGKAIPVPRLEAIPTAGACLECKSQAEAV